jgi:hypothetical protein
MSEQRDPGAQVDAGAEEKLEVKDLEVKDESADKVRGGKLYEVTTKGTHIPEVVIE